MQKLIINKQKNKSNCSKKVLSKNFQMQLKTTLKRTSLCIINDVSLDKIRGKFMVYTPWRRSRQETSRNINLKSDW